MPPLISDCIHLSQPLIFSSSGYLMKDAVVHGPNSLLSLVKHRHRPNVSLSPARAMINSGERSAHKYIEIYISQLYIKLIRS